MTHEKLQRICTPAEFMAMTPEERLVTVRKQIELDLTTWNQEVWIDITPASAFNQEDKPPKDRDLCGTAFCFAGWTVLLAGLKFCGPETVTDGSNVNNIPTAARELLGLDSTNLFSAGNTLDDIDDIIRDTLEGIYDSP